MVVTTAFYLEKGMDFEMASSTETRRATTSGSRMEITMEAPKGQRMELQKERLMVPMKVLQ